MSEQRTVFVVDDDEGARKSVCALVESMGVRTKAFASAEGFLDHYTEGSAGCLVTDLRMTGISGLELQEQLIHRHMFLPVIILTAFARTPITVQAVKAGAITVLDKPYTDDDLWDAVRAALAKDAAEREKVRSRQALRSRFEQLTTLERKVLDLIVQGLPNKAIANELDISIRTVATRRGEILATMAVSSTAELIRAVIACNADGELRQDHPKR